VVLLGSNVVSGSDDSIVLQSTTSTRNSGLYEKLLPLFKASTGITVQVVAVGTGQAIRNAIRGDGDVLLVHAKEAEQRFVAEKHGVKRFDVMYNDFVLVGPPDDPAGIRKASSVTEALAWIVQSGAVFMSRGDDSGTHKKELVLWREAGISVRESSGEWYRETGSGMGSTLNIAIGMGGYCLVDRGSWISFNNKRSFEVLFEGGAVLSNQYGVMLVNPLKHPHVNAKAGQAFIDWLLGSVGQNAIAAYRVRGQQLFFPNAK
jgi:tungstate transport system substrate-binding protein